MVDAVRNVQLVIHASEICNEKLYLFFLAVSAQTHKVGNLSVTVCCLGILCVVCDYLGQIHCVCGAVDNVRAVIGKSCTCLVSHGVNDTQKSIGECHTCQALCVVHRISLSHIAVVGIDKVMLDHLDSVESERVGVITVCGGDICLDCVCHSVHTCVSNKLLGHCFSQVRVNDSNIGGDLKVSDRILYSLAVVGDDRESSYLGSCARCGGGSAEMSLLAQLGKTEYLAHILKCYIGIFVLYPHSLCSVDR